MRLISIGKTPSCTICIPNDFVSSYHAEILLLDNGDIFLTDCGSRNGTFVNGKQIAPNVEVPVRRGDKIEFDNIALNWGQVPQIPLPDPSKVKGVYGVGKNQRNRFHLQGESVSRYHATFKEMKNGKWFIQDHSKNGTYINGNRIPANQDVPLKAKDSIVCGNVPCPNPVKGPVVPTWVWAVCGGAVAAVLLVFLMVKVFSIPIGHDTDPFKAIALVEQHYYVKVVFSDDPIKKLLDIDDWYYAGPDEMLATSRQDAQLRSHQGTAFFISKNGLLLTNRHVTNWIYADEHYSNGNKSEELKSMAEMTRRKYYDYFTRRFQLTEELEAMFDRWLKSPFSLVIETVSFGLRYPGRTYSSASEIDWAHLVRESDDNSADVSLLRLNSGETPKDRDWFDLNRSLDMKQLKLNVENYYTLGFPAGDILATVTNSEKYEPTSGVLHLSKSPGRYMLYMQGDKTIGGQSGSPIYDKKHRLIGILYGGYGITDNTNACPIIHAKNLVKDVLREDSEQMTFKSKNAY